MEESQSPRVTALVVSHNSAEALRPCVAALEASAGRERLEILVVDDGSEDGTSAIFDDFPNVITLRLPKQIGYTRAVNIGLGTAKGDLVLLLPPNVRVRPDTIGLLADRLETSSETGAVCPATPTAWAFPSPDNLALAWRTGELPGVFDVGAGETAVDYPKGAPILIRRKLLRNMNWLDKRFGHAWSDLELCSRIRNGNKSIIVMGDIPVDREEAGPPAVDGLEWADSAHGIGTWIGLHHGGGAAFSFRLSAAFHALGRGQLNTAIGIVTGAMIDGNQ